ncbi:tRNA 2-thiouridine(34) synthase MnmA [Candidatus Saccharibacteria bacterium 32-49-12]|nr:MAG: tRNA 2-thiouridine(34) synthase MnmA [Candidatus Saccharibacteria bacterium 32-49-12]
MSGGVDSSVTASLLVEQGYDVTGVYMKNWTQDMPGMHCPWAEDVADAKRVAVSLGIDFEVFDFENEYKQQVVDAMVSEYKAGRTPNPDVMCNQEIKFKLFLDTALARGADLIATGHYARVTPDGKLMRAFDENKDQTYFLYRVKSEALKKTLFPLGDMTKQQVRDYATEKNLWTADKKESMGICFVGQVGIREFLEQYITLEPGEIILQETGQVVGRHDSAMLYTIGQRHGLNIGGGLPYYVTGKDIQKNQVYVSQNIDNQSMWRDELTLTDLSWVGASPEPTDDLQVRLRHRGSLLPLSGLSINDEKAQISLKESERAVAAGQSAVIYRGDEVMGGGIIS